MFVKIYPENPQERLVRQAAEILQKGGIVIYPTDSVYAMGCSILHLTKVEDLERIKGYYTNSARLSFLCFDLSQLSNYCKPISNSVFKMMKRNLPGPFTFILEANNQVPKFFKGKKKTVGIRVPNNPILNEILRVMDCPIVSTSLPYDEQEPEYASDPAYIRDRYENLVDLIIDGGQGGLTPSAIVDCTGEEPELIREGCVPLID